MFLAENVTVVKDSKGRKLSVNRMDPMDQLDFFEACSGDRSSNRAWVMMALWAASCVAIDGVPVPMPTSPEAVKALARRLGNEGILAVRSVLDGDGADADPATSGVDMDLAKNSADTP